MEFFSRNFESNKGKFQIPLFAIFEILGQIRENSLIWSTHCIIKMISMVCSKNMALNNFPVCGSYFDYCQTRHFFRADCLSATTATKVLYFEQNFPKSKTHVLSDV